MPWKKDGKKKNRRMSKHNGLHFLPYFWLMYFGRNFAGSSSATRFRRFPICQYERKLLHLKSHEWLLKMSLIRRILIPAFPLKGHTLFAYLHFNLIVEKNRIRARMRLRSAFPSPIFLSLSFFLPLQPLSFIVQIIWHLEHFFALSFLSEER